jgi:hypothetical protein
MKCFLLWFYAFFLIGLLPKVCWAQNLVPLDPKDVEFKAQQLGGPTLPYQAVQIRSTLRNTSEKKRLGPIVPIGAMVGIKGPADTHYQGAFYYFERFERAGISVSGNINSLEQKMNVHLFLDPGKKCSLSVAFGKRISGPHEPGGRTLYEPVFPVPGTYTLKCGYILDAKTDERAYDVVEIQVLEPKGADQKVYELLQKDKALALEMLGQPLIAAPAADIYPKLNKLVEDYPNSSYIPYARLALARCYLTGKANLSGYAVPFPEKLPSLDDENIWQLRSGRVPIAMAADELEKAHTPPFDPKSKRQFNPSDFPFRPQALAIQARLGDRDSQNCAFYLHRDHRDSMQWIDQFAGMLLYRSNRETALALERLIQTDFPNHKDATSEEIWRWFRTQ